jgi:hypothetical protein
VLTSTRGSTPSEGRCAVGEHYLTAVSRSHRRPLGERSTRRCGVDTTNPSATGQPLRQERVRRYREWLASSRSCCGHPGPALQRKRTVRGEVREWRAAS